ncbi:MAG: class I SAM-dependent methyltransferase [Stellaceae bacterium]
MTPQSGRWGGGYVTDTPYVPGYYRDQSPLHLNLACLLGGFAGLDLGPGRRLCYLELGCGQGFVTLALAACNPAWTVIGVDFNPAHIAAAREFAATARIANARFIEADLATLAAERAADDIPEVDVASLHGLWSWVTDAVRAGIVRLLARKIRPGGVVHVSYNALPAWQGALGMQRLVHAAGKRLAAPSGRQAEAGFETVRLLAEAAAHHLRGNPFVASLIDHAGRAPLAYLAHEYMNDAWRPAFHTDVVAAFAEAKLDWVASAKLLENFSALMLSEEVRTVSARFDDPLLRELIKDMCLTRGLRRDVFIRGARRLPPRERDAKLGEVVLGLAYPAARFTWDFEVPFGRAALERDFFGPIVDALAQGPRPVRELLALPELPRRDNPGELVGMLVGTDQALPLLAPPGEPDARIRHFNAAAAGHFVRPENLNGGIALAASGGAPVPCTMLDVFVAARLDEAQSPDPAAWAASLGAGHPEDEQQRLRAHIDRLIAEHAPLWRQLGALALPPRTVR